MTHENDRKVINLENFKIRKKWKNLILFYDKLVSFFKSKKGKKSLKVKYKNILK